jgi:glycerol uptake facilitator-like aquaporin
MKYLVVKFWKFALYSVAMYIIGAVCGAALLALWITKSLDIWERSNRSRVEGYNLKEKLYHARNR